MALRLRYEIDTPQRLREHLHVVDGAGYFFFSGVAAPEGTACVLDLVFTDLDSNAVLRGHVWARPAMGGVWIELPGAARMLATEQSVQRLDLRLATEQLVLLEPAGHPGLLCRLRDVSATGARLAASAEDVGAPGTRVRIALPEAAPSGAQLEAFGRLVWAGEGEAGVEWKRGDLASRAAVRRLLQIAEEEWEGSRNAAHSATCRCMRDARPRVLLLG